LALKPSGFCNIRVKKKHQADGVFDIFNLLKEINFRYQDGHNNLEMNLLVSASINA